MKFELSLFRFDHKSDYLPYYTKHPIKIKNESTLLDIFKTINEDQAFGFIDCEYFPVVVNGIYTYLNITVKELKEHFGKDLTIEPMSIRRAYNDLLINEEDFNSRFDILSQFTGLDMLASYVDKDILETYNSYKLYYYASNTLNYEKNYIGDAALLLAYDLIQKFPKEEKAILKTIQAHDVGIEYHTNLEKRVYNIDPSIEEKINSLKTALDVSQEEQNFRVNNSYKMEFGEFDNTSEIKHDFSEFNIAYYEGSKGCNNTSSLIDELSAKKITLESQHDDLALDTFHINPDLTFKLTSTVMLEAFDQNADFIVVDDEDLFYLFDYNRKELKRVSGRDVLIPVLHKNELNKLSAGIHGSVKETLKKHIINPEII